MAVTTFLSSKPRKRYKFHIDCLRSYRTPSLWIKYYYKLVCIEITNNTYKTTKQIVVNQCDRISQYWASVEKLIHNILSNAVEIYWYTIFQAMQSSSVFIQADWDFVQKYTTSRSRFYSSLSIYTARTKMLTNWKHGFILKYKLIVCFEIIINVINVYIDAICILAFKCTCFAQQVFFASIILNDINGAIIFIITNETLLQ